MKPFLLLLGLASLLLSTAATTQAAGTYSDQGISISVPDGWRANTDLQGKNLVDIEAPDGFAEVIVDTVTDFKGDAEAWAKAYAELLGEKMDMKLLDLRPMAREQARARGAESG
jgi:hypothetical protein